jgi:integrase
MQPLNNVSMMKKNTVFEHIQSFFMSYGSNTASEYERDVRLFFNVVRHKSIEDLEIGDVEVDLTDIIKYRKFLQDSNRYKNNSINRLLSSIQSLYGHLKAHKEYRDVANTEIFSRVTKLPDDTQNIGFLSSDEAKYIAELALGEKHEGIKKKALILLAASTSMRKDSLLKIRYCDIKKHESKNGVYVIESDKLFDKGKMVKGREIDESLYRILVDIKGDKTDKDIVFDFSASGLDVVIKRLCKIANFDPNRNISFHSLKKAGIRWVREATGGDIVAITAQGGWSSPTVAMKNYLEKEVNLAGVGMFRTHDPDIFKKLTDEERLMLLESFGNGIKAKLMEKAQEILGERKIENN